MITAGVLGVVLTAGPGCGDETTTTTEPSGTTETVRTSTKTATGSTATTGTSTTVGANKFEVTLKGAEEVPAVSTQATGKAEFELSDDGSSLKFEVSVTGISDVTASHIHMAAAGSNGPIVAALFSGNKAGIFDGQLAEGTITAADLQGPLAGLTMNDLVTAMKSGTTYVNVHTAGYPAGEIRAQIK